MINPRTTIVRSVSPEHPEPDVIAEAAAALRQGKLVAFPTETVYGLGASALEEAAVAAIFAAKGRPSHNPLIVHVADMAAAQRLAVGWTENAARLAEHFWPGSLTVVLPKRPEVPDVVTAGGPTVGLRVPAHPVALALLQAAAIPIAAPSANRSSSVSPTTAAHVLRGLEGQIDIVLDAGPTPGGLESTVLDLTVDPPRLLRPGLVSVAQLESVLGLVSADQCGPKPTGEALRSPGLLERHYAPRARLFLTDHAGHSVGHLLEGVKAVGWLRLAPGASPTRQIRGLRIIEMPNDPTAYAARLYAALHELDEAGVDWILVDMPPSGDSWMAVHDRLRRAAQS